MHQKYCDYLLVPYGELPVSKQLFFIRDAERNFTVRRYGYLGLERQVYFTLPFHSHWTMTYCTVLLTVSQRIFFFSRAP